MSGNPQGASSADTLGIDLLTGGIRRFAALAIGTGLPGLLSTVLGAAVGVAIALLLPLQYTTSATFVAQGAQTSRLPVAIQGLAASVGLDRSDDYSPKFYADLVTSRPILLSAIRQQYTMIRDGRAYRADYMSIEGFDDRPAPRAEDDAIRHLAKRIATRADVRTNIITMLVTARDPELARTIANRLLAALDSLNITFRQEQARELREFYGAQVAAARTQLDSAEGDLVRFLQRNRASNAPQLASEEARFRREVDLKRAVYLGQVQQYEQARTQEARSVPTLTVLAAPFVPVRKSGPPRRLIVILCTLGGFGFLVTFRALRSQVRRFSTEYPAILRRSQPPH